MLQVKLRKAALSKEAGSQHVERTTFCSAATPKRWLPDFNCLKNGKDLKLWITGADSLEGDDAVKLFLKELTRIKEGPNYQSLTSLTVTFRYVSWRGLALSIVLKYLKTNFPNLKKLELNLPEDETLKLNFFVNPINPLPYLLGPHLSTLTNLHITGIISERVLKTLVKELQVNLKGLHTLHLDLREYDSDHNMILELAKQINANSRVLQNVYLPCSGFPRSLGYLVQDIISVLKPDINYKNLFVGFYKNMRLTKSDQGTLSNQTVTDLFINNNGLDPKEILKSIDKPSSLEIQFEDYHQDGGLLQLLKWISPKLEALKRLTFQFDIDTYNNDTLAISEMLGSHLKGLESLHLDFRWCDDLTDDIVLDLASKIGINLSGLQNLYLRFGKSEASYKSAIIVFNEIIPRMKTLKSFYVEFEGQIKINNNLGVLSLKEIYQKLDRAPYLSDLNFEFRQITDKSLLDFFEQIKFNIGHIEAINISFNEYRILEPDTLLKISQMIFPILVSLKHLGLNFAQCKKLDSSTFLALIAQISSHFKGLQSISLNFARCIEAINDDVLFALAEHFQYSSPELKSVDLNLQKCEHITDNSIKALSGSIPKLTTLYLVLEGCVNISDESILALCGTQPQITSALHNLESLASKYNRIKKIAEESILILSNEAELDFANLQNINLNKDSFAPTSNQSLKELHSRIESDHIMMQNFNLNLKESNKKIQTLIKEVTDSAELKFKGLRHLRLNFKGCSKITTLSLLALQQQIAHFKDIQSLSLDFNGCGKNIRSSILDFANYTRSHLNNLDTFELNGSRLQIKSADYNFEEIDYETEMSLSDEEVDEDQGSRLQENLPKFV